MKIKKLEKKKKKKKVGKKKEDKKAQQFKKEDLLKKYRCSIKYFKSKYNDRYRLAGMGAQLINILKQVHKKLKKV